MLAKYVTVPVPSIAGEKVAIFAIMFFVFFYGFFIDAASFIYSSEIYPTNIRARGMAMATFTYFAACIVGRSAFTRPLTSRNRLTRKTRLMLPLVQLLSQTLAGDIL